MYKILSVSRTTSNKTGRVYVDVVVQDLEDQEGLVAGHRVVRHSAAPEIIDDLVAACRTESVVEMDIRVVDYGANRATFIRRVRRV